MNKRRSTLSKSIPSLVIVFIMHAAPHRMDDTSLNQFLCNIIPLLKKRISKRKNIIWPNWTTRTSTIKCISNLLNRHGDLAEIATLFELYEVERCLLRESFQGSNFQVCKWWCNAPLCGGKGVFFH